MKSWKHWPYWLKGGVIGTIFGLLFYTFLGESCNRLSCLILSYGPGLLMVKFLVFISVITPDQFTGSSVFWDTMVVVSWTLLGIIVGLIVSYIKSIKNSKFQNLR